MPDRTPEQRQKVLEKIHRADCLSAAFIALDTAVEAEESESYAEYLDTTIREFLDEEHAQAQNAYREYQVELFAKELESLG